MQENSSRQEGSEQMLRVLVPSQTPQSRADQHAGEGGGWFFFAFASKLQPWIAAGSGH